MPQLHFHRLERRDWLIAGCVFAIAFAMRLLFLFMSPDVTWPHSIFYEGDATTWMAWGVALEAEQPFEFNLPLRTPGVAYLLHWLPWDVTGPPFTAFKVVWCLVSAASGALAYLCFARVFNRRVSMIAAGLCVFSYGLHITATSLNNEAIYLFVLMLIVLATLDLLHRSVTWLALLAGALHGLATLIRAEHTLLLLMMVIYLAWRWHMQARSIDGPTHTSDTALIGVARRIALLGCMIAASIAICLPWSMHGTRAIHQYNTVPAQTLDFDAVPLRWTPDARAYLNSLPAFTRYPSFGAATFCSAQERKSQVTAADVKAFFIHMYGSVPEPISRFVFVSMKAPLDFALANHPQSDGGFSKAALATPDEPDPNLHPARPDHLRLINHGFAAGWDQITSDFPGWLRLVGRKLLNFTDGITLGFTAANIPIGYEGVRRPVDIFVARRGDAMVWKFLVISAVVIGAVIAMVRQQGGIWLLIISYKLVITILFYGYARQAVSILPAFYVLMALPIDWVITWIEKRIALPRWSRLAVPSTLIVLLIAIEVFAAVGRPQLTITGPVDWAPQWGQDAFESHELLRISPSDQSR